MKVKTKKRSIFFNDILDYLRIYIGLGSDRKDFTRMGLTRKKVWEPPVCIELNFKVLQMTRTRWLRSTM